MTPSRSTQPHHSHRWLIALAGILVTLLTVSACATSHAAPEDGASRTITDATGTEVRVPAQPERVVTLSELDLDSALALGITPVGVTAGRGQQGVPRYLSDRAADLTLVGTVTGPQLGKVIKVKPDLILAGQLRDKQVLRKLRDIAPTVVTYKLGDEWKTAFRNVAKAVNKQDKAGQVLKDYKHKVDTVRKALGPDADAVVSVVRWSPNGPHTINQGTFASAVLGDLGVRRPAQQQKHAVHSMPLSMENLDEIDADWIFMGTLSAHGAAAKTLRSAKQNPAFAQLHAAKQHHVVTVDGSKWTSLGGPLAALSVLDDVQHAMAAS